jgi:hypothetical protein
MAVEDFNLPPAESLVRDGGFEGVLTDSWALSGSTAAVLTTTARSGQGAVLLGQDFVGDLPDGSGNSTISQTITIPADAGGPILSFSYRLTTSHPNSQHGFEALIIDENRNATYLPGPLWFRGETDWRHQWFDLSGFRGQRVQLYFNLWQQPPPPGEAPTLASVDEVSVGPVSRMPTLYFPMAGKGSGY